MQAAAPPYARFAAVLHHVEAHFDQPLQLTELAAVAGLSPHHFHRLFHAGTGLTAADYVQRMRLRQASCRLAFRGSPTHRNTRRWPTSSCRWPERPSGVRRPVAAAGRRCSPRRRPSSRHGP